MKPWQLAVLVLLAGGFVWLFTELSRRQREEDTKPTFVAQLRRWDESEPHIPRLDLPPVRPLKAQRAPPDRLRRVR